MTTLQAKFVQNSNASWVLESMSGVDSRIFPLASIKDLIPIREYLLQLQAQKLRIDLLTTERLDSQGMQLLLTVQQYLAKEKIQVILCNPNVRLRRLLRVMQFDRVFEIEEDNFLGTVMLLGPHIIRHPGL